MIIVDELSTWMREGFEKAWPVPTDCEDTALVIPAVRPEFGDYQCNTALSLAKRFQRLPREVAERVVATLAPHPAVETVRVEGAGFINVILHDAWIAERTSELTAEPRLGVPNCGQGRTVVMDYGSPNITKPLHIGHLRSHNIGSTLDRIYRFLGYRVIADNHLGDWGTQFGITLMGYRHFGDDTAMRDQALEELERVYILSYERARQDTSWREQCRRELVKLQNGDPENRALWQRFVELSVRELDRTYQRLGIHYDLVRGESHYHDLLPALVADLQDRGLARESEGALVVFLEQEGLPPCIVRKSDGGFNYATTDIATVLSRVAEFQPERIVYVTDERQQLHFRQVFAICRRLGITTRLDHVWFGLMRMKDGVIRTREGGAIRLEELLDKAEEMALAVVRQASPELSDEQHRRIAQAVGIGAVKYADLSQNPQSVVTFSWEKALSLTGNSGPYLQYAYARIASVREKYQNRFPGDDLSRYSIAMSNPSERALALRLIRFPETIRLAAETYKPNVLTDYLFGLAQTFSTYYQSVPFLRAEPGLRESRVRLCEVVARVLGQGLLLLGLEPLERI